MSAMLAGSVFIDSNTFLYALDRYAAEKRQKARLWLQSLAANNNGVANLQVLNEVANVLIKRRERFDNGNPFDHVDIFADFGSTPIDRLTVEEARSIHATSGYAWWDCILIAAAIELGCTHFLSEDLQDGQIIQGLTIVSPFAHTPEQVLNSR